MLLDWLRQAGLIQQPIGSVHGRRFRVDGRWVISFVTASYLGLECDRRIARTVARGVQSWGMSTGTPRLLGFDRLTRQCEREIARLTGFPAALLFPSTTHLALDLLPALTGSDGALFFDAWTYPTVREGVKAVARSGARVFEFAHNDLEELERLLRSSRVARSKVITCDGVYPEGGGTAPLPRMTALAQRYGAILYVDDSHGVGVWGRGPRTALDPYGRGGGGLARLVRFPVEVGLLTGTLSKGFGVPIAFAAGTPGLVESLEKKAASFVHSNPPSLANIAAAIEALRIEKREGVVRRRRLAGLVLRFQRGVRTLGADMGRSGWFPIQTIRFRSTRKAMLTAQFLRKEGVWSALQFAPLDFPSGAVLRFFITARHTNTDIDWAVDALSRATRLRVGGGNTRRHAFAG